MLFFGALIVGLVFVITVPRLLNLAITPDRVYPLYGFHYALHRTIARMTNVKAFTNLFGDSSYIVDYLRWLGYDLCQVEQTGSNFGQMVKHENPYLSSIGRGTMVADGLSIINADFSSTSFCVSRATIGPHNFLGNNIAYPSQGKTGANCLLATKVLVPIDGKVRENVGLLGSPSFEIPRTVERDSTFDHLIARGRAAPPSRRQEQAQHRHHRAVLARAVVVSLRRHPDRWGRRGLLPVARCVGDRAGQCLILLFSVVYWVLVDRLVTLFIPVRPLFCSIYDRAVLATRTVLEGACGGVPPGLQRNPVQEPDLAFARCPAGPQGLR